MEESKSYQIFAAPVQGLTEVAWRHFHRDIYGDDISAYHTPFLRVERGEIRRRDLRDLGSELNGNVDLIPQIIFKDLKEFRMLCDEVVGLGYREIDINMGCPFPPQVHHGRGAGMIANTDLLRLVSEDMSGRYERIQFSIKMRLGVESPVEWEDSMEMLDRMPLSRLTVHPRTARQQYQGDIHYGEFSKLLSMTRHKVIYNGDITLPEHIYDIIERFPAVSGVMIGRGLFSRPSLVAEWSDGSVWDEGRRHEAFMRLHESVYSYYRSTLSGDSQILGKMKPFWEYMSPQLDRKVMKAIKKASSLRKYDEALMMLSR